MRILVPVKRVIDYDVKVRVKSDGTGVESGFGHLRGCEAGTCVEPEWFELREVPVPATAPEGWALVDIAAVLARFRDGRAPG